MLIYAIIFFYYFFPIGGSYENGGKGLCTKGKVVPKFLIMKILLGMMVVLYDVQVLICDCFHDFQTCSGTLQNWNKYQKTWWTVIFLHLVNLSLNWSYPQN